MEEIGEAGFDRLRFGSPRDVDGASLSDALALLIRIPGKARLDVRDLDPTLLRDLVATGAGAAIDCRQVPSSPDALAVALQARTLTLANDQPCGLRDLILAAVLFRVHREAGSPADYDLDELVQSARLTLLEDLPHAMDYSSAVEMRSGDDHGTDHHLGFEQVEAESGEREIHFQVA